MKKPNALLREYVSSLSDVELRDLGQRFSQRLCGDYAEAAQMLQRDREVDQWLRTAESATNWFEMVDRTAEAVTREQKRRETVPKEVAEV
jgi:hypothetical protein